MKPDIFPNTAEGYTDFINDINEIIKTVKGEGLRFGYHNHELEFQKFGGVRAIDRLIEECPDLYFIPDVFWIQAKGVNPAVYLEKLKGRINIVHFKDYRISGRTRPRKSIFAGETKTLPAAQGIEAERPEPLLAKARTWSV